MGGDDARLEEECLVAPVDRRVVLRRVRTTRVSSLSLSHTHTLSRALSLTLSLSLTHTLSHSHTLALSLCVSRTHTHTRSLSKRNVWSRPLIGVLSCAHHTRQHFQEVFLRFSNFPSSVPIHTEDYKPPFKSQLAQRKLAFRPFVLRFWSRTTRISREGTCS